MAKTAEEKKAYAHAYYVAHREAIKAHVRAYTAANIDKIRAARKVFRNVNKARLSVKAKTYYKAHRDTIIAYQKALQVAKRDAVKIYKKEWWAKNREQFAEKRKRPEVRARIRTVNKKWYHATYHTKHRAKFLARNAKRRALKVQAPCEPIDFMQVLRDCKGLCGICKKPLDLFGIDFDHIVPLSKGGTHTNDNIQATHAYCNRSKGAKVG